MTDGCGVGCDDTDAGVPICGDEADGVAAVVRTETFEAVGEALGFCAGGPEPDRNTAWRLVMVEN